MPSPESARLGLGGATMAAKNRGVTEEPQAVQLLKEDAFGRVECVEVSGRRHVRRVACGGSVPGSRAVARWLLGKERRALERLSGLEGIPRLLDVGETGGELVLVRSWLEGVPLWATRVLRRDYFTRLEDLVRALHARGVCHNDLHKETNILVGPRGLPALLDFQLASVHPRASRSKRVRAAEDLRHVNKHRRRYEAGMEGFPVPRSPGGGPRPSLVARLWMAAGKPLLRRATARLGRLEPSEPRRPREGPWPTWTDVA